ncbi:aminoglycoside phosphotransferase family protein [Terrabacter sp. NPDC080008]|uniref:aminoglycoside phosphotransferase family protein n=1 Tax=Terrabacter sp. NPDC080008 TaxID=3155176 RepID=UPI00345063C8
MRDWLEQLPRLSTQLMARWSCVPAGDVRAGHGGVVVPVRRADGTRAVLKMSLPSDRDDFESTVLSVWGGRGAVLLLERDDELGARLLENLEDRSLAEVEDAEVSMAVVGGLVRRLAVPAPEGLPRLTEAYQQWALELPDMNRRCGRALPDRTVAAAVASCRDLGSEQPDTVLHGDLHQNNVLRGTREEWLAIDPLGVVGDLATECLTHLRDRWVELHHQDQPERALRRRIDVFAEAAHIDRERARRWTQLRATVTILRSPVDLNDGGLHAWVATALTD